jgi:hypothetical protein
MTSRGIALLNMLLVTCSSPTWAIEKGESCTLQSPLPMVVNRPQGRIEATLDRGVVVSVLVVGDEGRSRVTTGDAAGSVATLDLESACAGTLQICRLESPVMLYAKTRSDSQAWRLKPGATVSVLRSGKTWAHLRVDDLEGFSKSDEVKAACRGADGGTVEDTVDTEITEDVERGEGPGILFLPLLLEGTAPAGPTAEVGDVLFERLAAYRPDAARLPQTTGLAAGKWKADVDNASARARSAGFAYVVVGKVGVETVDGKVTLMLSTAIVDAKAKTILKAARVRPTTRPQDPWPEQLLATLLSVVDDAPGGRIPTAPQVITGEKAPLSASPPASLAAALPERAPWYANPWGYAVAGLSTGMGAAAGVAAWMSLQENAAADDTSSLDAGRGDHRARALALGITSDALAAAAIVTGVVTIVVFATRAGLDDSPSTLAPRAQP